MVVVLLRRTAAGQGRHRRRRALLLTRAGQAASASIARSTGRCCCCSPACSSSSPGSRRRVLTPDALAAVERLRPRPSRRCWPWSRRCCRTSSATCRRCSCSSPSSQNLADPQPAWLVLAMASTLAGNFTILGSVANLIVVERARRHGIEIGFWAYFARRRAAHAPHHRHRCGAALASRIARSLAGVSGCLQPRELRRARGSPAASAVAFNRESLASRPARSPAASAVAFNRESLASRPARSPAGVSGCLQPREPSVAPRAIAGGRQRLPSTARARTVQERRRRRVAPGLLRCARNDSPFAVIARRPSGAAAFHRLRSQ